MQRNNKVKEKHPKNATSEHMQELAKCYSRLQFCNILWLGFLNGLMVGHADLSSLSNLNDPRIVKIARIRNCQSQDT